MISPSRSLLPAAFAVLVSSCGSDASSTTEPIPLDLSRTVIVVPNGQADVPTLVTIELRDEQGGIFTDETPSPAMEVSGENAGAETEVTRGGDGTFTASYTPVSLGMDTLRFTHEGSALPGGPFPSRVRIVFETGVGTPILDGVLSAGEWDGAPAYPVFAGPLAGSTVRFMVDDTDLYAAVRVPDPGSGNGSFAVRFDNTLDLMPAGDDLVSQGQSFYDGHFEGVYAPDDVPHGDGVRASADGWTVVELRHPLSSGDSQDISVARGGSVGVCVAYSSDLTNLSSEFSYPPSCISVTIGVPTYAELIISP